jgi:predicted site-specific integrase-resolvase
LTQNWFSQSAKQEKLKSVILNQGEDASFEEDLAKDALAIVKVFSARLYGSRSRKSQKSLERAKAAVESLSC